MKTTKEEKARALESLKRCFPAGSTVYGITRNISRSGMARSISIISMQDKDSPSWPNWAVAALTGYQWLDTPQGAVRSKGCGYDHLHQITDCIETALGYKPGTLKHQYL